MYSQCSLPWGRVQELNACCSCISHMVLFLTWTQKSHYIYRSCIKIFTQHIMPHPTQPLASQHPAFTYLENQLLCLWWQIPIHPCLWSANNCPTLCLPSHPFTPHSSNYIIYIDDISNLSHLRPGQLQWKVHIASNKDYLRVHIYISYQKDNN